MAKTNMKQFLQDLYKWAKKEGIACEGFSGFDEEERKTVTDYTFIGDVYNKVVNFLNSNSIYGTEQMNNVFSVEPFTMYQMLPSSDHEAIFSKEELKALCDSCGIPSDQTAATMAAIYRTIGSYTNRTALNDHWMSATEGLLTGVNATPMSDIYPTSALGDMVTGIGVPGKEAFGATVDTVIPDLRMALTVILIKPHKGVMSRLIQRRTLAGAVITYVITRNELYDLQRSQDKMSLVRNEYGHRHNLLELYRRPDPTDMSLTRIMPLKVNDTEEMTGDPDGVLVDDNIIKFNKELNLFDLVLDETKEYRKRFNYTDLVSEGVAVDAIYVTINGEKYRLSVAADARARLMHLQTSEQFSGDRETNLMIRARFNQTSRKEDGTLTQIFTNDPLVEDFVLTINAYVYCDLQTANVRSSVSHSLTAVSNRAKDPVTGKPAEVSQAMKDALAILNVTVDGFELDARFSEENLRQIDRAARSLTYVTSYEMPQGKTIIVDFSMQQSMPEQVLNVAQELQSIGIDHRNIQMFLKTMRHVHDECLVERNDELYNAHSNGKTIHRNYVSGQQVNPEIFMGVIDLAQVKSVRDSDMAGDIRQYVDGYMTKALSLVHYRSQYLTQLDSNKVPHYKVLTSSYILENLLAVPHIHEHLMPQGMNAEDMYKEKKVGAPIEYSRTLMSGVKLDVITSSFYYLQDKIIVIPFVEGDPSNVLNFAHNWDLGQFVANYTPVDNNQVNRRVFMNTRECPIITCPIGAIIEVKNMDVKLPDITSSQQICIDESHDHSRFLPDPGHF